MHPGKRVNGLPELDYWLASQSITQRQRANRCRHAVGHAGLNQELAAQGAVAHAIRWNATASANLRWRSWGTVHFVFDIRSSQTHFLNQLAVEIFAMLQERPLTAADVHDALRLHYDFDDDQSLIEAVDASLLALDRSGLIERQ